MSNVQPDPFMQVRQVLSLADHLLDSSLQRAGFTMTRGEMKVLQLIADGNVFPDRITRVMGCTQQYVSKCLTALVAERCVTSTQNLTDKRRRTVEVTPRGMRAVAIANAWNVRFAQLTPDDLEGEIQRTWRAMQELDQRGNLAADVEDDAISA